MKRVIYIIGACLVLFSCSPSEDAIQEAIQKTQQALPKSSNTPEPTSTIVTDLPEPTQTPEYCPREETGLDLYKLKEFEHTFALFHNRGINDPSLHESTVVELTKKQLELDDLEVSECLEYAKELLNSVIQNSIDAMKHYMAGNQAAYQEDLVNLHINGELFGDELDRIEKCLPNCEP